PRTRHKNLGDIGLRLQSGFATRPPEWRTRPELSAPPAPPIERVPQAGWRDRGSWGKDLRRRGQHAKAPGFWHAGGLGSRTPEMPTAGTDSKTLTRIA